MAKQDLHFSITASNDDLKRKLAESRQAILDSAKTAEAQASRVDGSFKRMALSAAAGFSAISFGKSIIRVRGEMQMMEASFEVMLGSKAKANKMIAEIKQLAIDSPLEMPQVSSAVQTLLGYGVAADKVMGIVGQLSDVSKGNADQFRALSLAYAQVQSTGKLMEQDLLQMINAGFNPLKVISEQTGKSVGQLKEEMASGAISAEMVSAAFDKVTSAGGMFYQMTQKQAEGIVGVQATFEDAITNQMNKFGEKNEELIIGGYRFATSVVENADVIGKALGVIVVAYGSYKAAIIAVSVAEKVIASSRNVSAWFELAKGIKTAKDAQVALNLAMGTNPILKIVSLLIAAGTALFLFAGETDKATDALDDFDKKQGELRSKSESLIRTIQDENETEYAKIAAYEQLATLMPNLAKAYDIEAIKVLKAAEAQRELNKARDEAEYQNAIGNVAKYSQEVDRLQQSYDSITSSDLATPGGADRFARIDRDLKNAKKELDTWTDQLVQYNRKMEVANEATLEPKVKLEKAQAKLAQIEQDFAVAKTKLEEEEEKLKAGKILYIDYQVQARFTILKNEKEQQEGFISGFKTQVNKTYKQEYDTAAEEWQDAKRELQKIEKDKATYSKEQYEAAKKREEETASTYKGLGGKVSSASTKEQKDYRDAAEQALLSLEQMKIELLQAGREKELAQIEQTKKEKLAAIDKEQKEVADLLLKGGLPKEQQARLTQKSASLKAQKPLVGQQATQDTSAVNKKYDDEIADNWKALTSVFLSEEEKRTGAIRDEYNQRRKWLDEFYKGGSVDAATYAKFSIQIDATEAKKQLDTLTADYQTYTDRRKAIETKFDANIAALQAKNNDGKLNGNIAEAEKQKKAALSKIKIDETAQSIDFTHLFGNLDNLTLPSMKTLRDKIKAWIDEASNSLAPEDLKTVSDAFQNLEIKIADKDPFVILKSSANELKTANERIAKAQDKVVESQIAAQNAANILAVAQQRVTSAQKEYNEALESKDQLKIVNAQAKLYAAQNDLNDANAKGVSLTKKLTDEEQNLTQAQEDRAAAVLKANEAIGSIADKGQQIVGASQDVLGILSDLGVEVSDQTREVIDGIGKVMEGLGSIDLEKPMSVVTGSIKMLSGFVQSITSLFGGSKKTLEELEYRQKEASEKQYFAELEISQLYRDRYEWAQKIGESTLQYMKRQGEELEKQGTDNAKEERALMDKLMNTEYKSGEHFEKTGLFGWGPGRIVEEHTSLAGKSWKEIELLASSGALSEEGMKYYEAIKKAKEEGVDLAQKQGEYLEKMREITTGSTYDSVVNGIVDGFKSGKRSASDFADSFGELMSGAVESALSLLADQKTREWYESFAKMGEDGYTKEEIATLKNDWIALNEQLAQDAQNLETVTGVKLGDKKEQNESSLTGQIQRTMTEQTAAEFGGIWRGQHEKLSSIDRKMDLGITNLLDIARTNLLIEQNTRRTADNTDGLRDVVNEVGKAISATNERLGQVIKNTKTDNGTL